MHGVMAPAKLYSPRPLMLAAGTPNHPPRGLMSTEASAFAAFDPQLELRRLLWTAASVLAVALYLLRAAR
jgi:hypothetical protein